MRPRPGWLSTWRRPRSLRAHLLLIVIVAFIPLLLFSAVTVSLFAREQRVTFRRGATERTLTLLTAIDTELKRSVAALEALAVSQYLDPGGDLQLFQRSAERTLRDRPEWLNVHVAPPSGLQVLNLLRPATAALHQVIDAETFLRAVRSLAPVAGNLFREPFTQRLVFPVRVPVIREGELVYVLTALVDPGVIHELLSSQDLPADWVGVVLDARRSIVARIPREELVGQPASESLRAALDGGDAGWFQGHTVEGWPVYTPFHRSAFSGWSVAMGIPRSAVEAPLRRSLTYLGAFGVLLLGSSLAVAWVLSRRTARSLEVLAAQAKDLGLGRRPRGAAGTGIYELDRLQHAFALAEELIHARSEERDRVESSLRHAEAELRRSEQRKDHFLAMLGHELRNPLSVVRTAVQLFREVPSEEAAEPRAMIERQVAHMTKLLDDLLDVSRIAQGRIQMARELCDLSAIVRQTAEDHRETLERGGLELELDVPWQPLWVMGDRTRLAQAVGNLLQNALKYSDAGGEVMVWLREDPGGASATVTVRDTGVGMEPEILEHAFEAFTQADRTIARSRGGLGLGLPLVKGLVEAHGGSVVASSEGSGRGTEVVVRLPLEPALQAPAEPPQAAVPRAEDGRSRRILVIEDNEMAARSMHLYLSGLGHAVSVAHSGTEGIELARREEPEVVVCDIGLPGADGYEVARALAPPGRTDAPYLIAVSGYGQPADRARAREAGFDRHLTKPVDLDELRRLLREPRPTPPRT